MEINLYCCKTDPSYYCSASPFCPLRKSEVSTFEAQLGLKTEIHGMCQFKIKYFVQFHSKVRLELPFSFLLSHKSDLKTILNRPAGHKVLGKYNHMNMCLSMHILLKDNW